MRKSVFGLGVLTAFLLGVGSTLAFISFSRRERKPKYTCGCDPTMQDYSRSGEWKTTVTPPGIGPIYIDAVPSETPDTVWVYPATTTNAGGLNSNVTWSQGEFPGMEINGG
jgi:hypothetical protein